MHIGRSSQHLQQTSLSVHLFIVSQWPFERTRTTLQRRVVTPISSLSHQLPLLNTSGDLKEKGRPEAKEAPTPPIGVGLQAPNPVTEVLEG
jgi:hypothetical protein